MRKHIIQIILAFAAILLGGCGPTGYMIKPVPLDERLEETTISRDPGLLVMDKIAVIDVDGVMFNVQSGGLFGSGENPVSVFQEKLDRAKDDDNVKAVMLRINSPGGSVAASDAMHHMLVSFRKETRKPVICCMMDMAASGGYYLACGGDGIMAQPATVTGSIGTIMQTVSFAGTMEKLGIEAVTIKSGELKDLASPLKKLTPTERELLQKIISRFYESFLGVVLSGRPGLSREKLLPLADGRVFTADQALEAGLIDRIGYPGDAVKWAKQQAKVKAAKVIMYHRPYGYKANLYSTATTTPPAGALVNIEIPNWLKSQGPQFLYLWQPDLAEK
jgi:protease IV